MKLSLPSPSRFFEKRGSFFRGIATVMTGTVISRLIALAALPVVSRLYSPEEFGVMALFALVTVTVGCIAGGRYEIALVLPEEERDAMHLVIVAMVIATFASLVSGICFWFWRGEIAEFLGAGELNFWLLISPLVIWMFAVMNIMQFWVIRQKQFGTIQASDISGTAVNVTLQIMLHLLFKPGAAGLILGNVGQMFTTLSVSARGAFKTLHFRGFGWAHAWQMAKRYKNFPLLDAWANFLNTVSREFPLFVLGVFFSAGIVGLYSIAYRIMSMPVTVISTAVTRVFLPEAKVSFENGTLDELALGLLRRLLALSMTPALMIMVAGPELVAIVLGEQWIASGVYVQWLAVFMLMFFVVMPVLQVLIVIEKQRQRLIYQVVLAAGRVVALLIGGYLADPVLAVALASSIGGFIMMVTIVIVLGYTGVAKRTSLSVFANEFLMAIPFALGLLAIKSWPTGDLTVLLAFLALGVLFIVFRFKSIVGEQKPA